MTEIKNLWPDDLLKGDDLLLPITVLQEQAKYLNEMTRNIVVATIRTEKVSLAIKNKLNETKPAILHTLKIVAPAIGNYDFDLVRLIQEELLPYPLRVYAPITDQQFEITNSEELEAALIIVFNDKKTIATLQGLILQSK